MAVNVEDAGFEIRDQIMWVYGSGFPKSHNLKDQWEGWGTALKPAHEPIVLARKPFKGKVSDNLLKNGTGALNIDGCRVGDDEISVHNAPKGTFAGGEDGRGSDTNSYKTHIGRWPANFIHDGLEEEWSKYFYCAKASKQDRNEGCEDLEEKEGVVHIVQSANRKNAGTNKTFPRANHHPTVKPTELMRYLCRLITPKDGIVLDPFMGSGSTGKAAILEGFSFIGIELSEEYLKIAQKRCQETIK
jgi:site-specific DNA-methyltransferase (adenine-specific)